jgi:hypothetical protein
VYLSGTKKKVLARLGQFFEPEYGAAAILHIEREEGAICGWNIKERAERKLPDGPIRMGPPPPFRRRERAPAISLQGPLVAKTQAGLVWLKPTGYNGNWWNAPRCSSKIWKSTFRLR